MKIRKIKPQFSFAITGANGDKKAFKSAAGIKGWMWFETEMARDAEMSALSGLASIHNVDLVPATCDMVLA